MSRVQHRVGSACITAVHSVPADSTAVGRSLCWGGLCNAVLVEVLETGEQPK